MDSPRRTDRHMAKHRRRGDSQGVFRRGAALLRRRTSSAWDDPSAWLGVIMAEDRLPADLRLSVTVHESVATPYRVPGAEPDAPELPVVVHGSTTPKRHGVHLYRVDEEIVASVTDVFEAALDAGQGLLLVATADHRMAIEAEMRARGLQLDPGWYQAVDAAETLDRFLVDGAPHRHLFRAVVGNMVEDLASRRPLCIYGEMVNLLWEQGDVVSAMTLEGFWNDLGAEMDFFLLCGYRTDGDADMALVEGVCGLHSHLVGHTDDCVVDG